MVERFIVDRRSLLLLLATVAFVGCGEDSAIDPVVDAGRRCLPTRGCSDSRDGGVADGGAFDSSIRDGGADHDGGFLRDAGPRDGGPPRDAGPARDGGPPRDGGLPCPMATSGWTPLITSLEANGSPSTPVNALSVAVDGLLPVVAWTEGTPATLHIRRDDGTGFVNFGSPFDDQPGNSLAYDPRVIARNGEVLLMHAEFDLNAANGLFIRRWDGQTWMRVDDDAFLDVGIVFGTDLYFDLLGRPIAAVSIGNPRKIDVRRIDATGLVTLAPTLGLEVGAQLGATYPWLGEDAMGRLIVAFAENGVRVFVRNAADTDWSAMGPTVLAANGGLSTAPRLARFDPATAPVIAFNEPDGQGDTNVYVYRFNTTTWDRIGDGSSVLVAGGPANIRAVEQDVLGRIVVAVTVGDVNTQRLYVLRSSGNTFANLGSMPLSAFGAVVPVGDARMVLDRCARPIVAFTEAVVNGDRSVQIFRYDGP